MKRIAVVAGCALALAGSCFFADRGASSANVFDGQQIFRFDTFGDEQLWTRTLQMEQVLGAASPATALSLGLKVDADALPAAVARAIRANEVDLNDPAITRQLLALNAVVGIVGRVNDAGTLESVGITCGLCHSTVDDSVVPGIGHRLDGWPNRSLDVGSIIALSPVVTPEQQQVFHSWGRGKFDPRLQAFNGTSFQSLNATTLPVVIPPAFGLQKVGFETVTGDGPISYWNNYVAVTQMGGHGSFSDDRIGLTITQTPDMVTPKLAALVDYELHLRTPNAPTGSFQPDAASRGKRLFNGTARCSECHTSPTFTDVLDGPDPTVPLLHAPSETGMEPVYASRSATGMYRTEPLRALWQHPPYFHDGSAPDLPAVVDHYDSVLSLGLTPEQKADLVEYLKSL